MSAPKPGADDVPVFDPTNAVFNPNSKRGSRRITLSETLSTSLVSTFKITVAKNMLDGTLVTLFIAILAQILGLIIRVTNVLLLTVISDMIFAHLDGLPAYQRRKEKIILTYTNTKTPTPPPYTPL